MYDPLGKEWLVSRCVLGRIAVTDIPAKWLHANVKSFSADKSARCVSILSLSMCTGSSIPISCRNVDRWQPSANHPMLGEPHVTDRYLVREDMGGRGHTWIFAPHPQISEIRYMRSEVGCVDCSEGDVPKWLEKQRTYASTKSSRPYSWFLGLGLHKALSSDWVPWTSETTTTDHIFDRLSQTR